MKPTVMVHLAVTIINDRGFALHADCPGVGGRYWALINIYRSPAIMFELTRLKKRRKKEC